MKFSIDTNGKGVNNRVDAQRNKRMYQTHMSYRYANGQIEHYLIVRFDQRECEITAMENVRKKCVKNGEVYKKENIVKMITTHVDTNGKGVNNPSRTGRDK